MKTRNIIIILSLCFFACKSKQTNDQEKFDKIRWSTMSGTEYPYRNTMLKDLIANYELKGLKKDEVEDLLGAPNRTDSGYLFYLVDRTVIAGFFTLHTKTLVIKLDRDSTVEWRKIHE
jgi:hypothetical protein